MQSVLCRLCVKMAANLVSVKQLLDIFCLNSGLYTTKADLRGTLNCCVVQLEKIDCYQRRTSAYDLINTSISDAIFDVVYRRP